MTDSKSRYGLVPWENVKTRVNTANSNRDTTPKDIYLNLQNGDNILRVFSQPHIYASHKFKVDEFDFGKNVKCSANSAEGICPLCSLGSKEGGKLSDRYWIGVINRKTNQVKILDVGELIMKQLKGFRDTPGYGNPDQFDVNIKVDRQAKGADYYKVIPMPPIPKPMSVDDLALIEKFDASILQQKCMPSTPEQVQKRVDYLVAQKNKSAGKPETASAKSNMKVTGSNTSVSDADLEFPPVD